MKTNISRVLALIIICSLLFALPVYAVGDGNIDNGAASVSA